MRARSNRGKAWATGLSLVLHVLVLTGMVVGLHVAVAPPEDRAIELQLMPRPKSEPRPQPFRTQPLLPTAPPSLRPRPSPQAPANAPLAAAPPAPQTPQAPPAPAPHREVAGPTFQGTPSGRMLCDNPLYRNLTPEQEQACANSLSRVAQAAKPLPLNIAPDKLAEFERASKCRERLRGGIPHSGEDSVGTGIHGLGDSPTLKECPPADR